MEILAGMGLGLDDSDAVVLISSQLKRSDYSDADHRIVSNTPRCSFGVNPDWAGENYSEGVAELARRKLSSPFDVDGQKIFWGSSP